MTCLDDNQIVSFLEGQLQGESAATVTRHLDACASCRRLLAQVAMSLPESATLQAETPGSEGRAAPTLETFHLGRLIGRQIGNFRVTGLMGAGAMGVVFSGVHVLLQHKVAIKVMQLQGMSPEMLEQGTARFFTEAKALTEIQSSPHVIQIHDFGRLEEENLYYYVMELLEGQTLEQEIQRRERFTLAEALPYLEQICAGLSAVHQRQILHRDLKPANIFILRGTPLRLKLLDFGLAKRLHIPQQMTADGLGMGSPLYAAPELVLGDQAQLGPPTDIYALGVITYRMLAGQMPWPIPAEAGPYKLFLWPTEHDPTPLRTHRPDLPLPLAAVIEAALSRTPEDRPATAAAFYGAVSTASLGTPSSPRVLSGPGGSGSVLSDEHSLSSPEVAAPTRRRIRWRLLGLLGLLLCAAFCTRWSEPRLNKTTAQLPLFST